MERRKWLWKRKSSEKSPGETESSGSISSLSERYSDDQEAFKASPNNNTQSPEVTSKAAAGSEEVNDSVRILTDKLSAALLNVSAKEDLVQQHVKVAEEAVAGWEKAENEVEVLKQRLDAAAQQNLALEDRVGHLDGALRECVRQLRQAREEQEQKIHEAVVNKTCEWESTKSELESQLDELRTKIETAKAGPAASVNPDLYHKLGALEKENSSLMLELQSQAEELEIRTIERDLSTQAAETASKQQLESIKKVARIEAECRRLKVMVHKSSSINDCKSVAASSVCVESSTDSHSDNGEQVNAVDIDTRKTSNLELNERELSCSNSWASALIAELDQFKNEKSVNRSLTSSSIKIDLMDDFLEMERLAALPEAESKSGSQCLASEAVANQNGDGKSPLRAELEAMIHRTAELEEKLAKVEAEKAELELALSESQTCLEASQIQLKEAEMKLEDLQRELDSTNKLKQSFEFEFTSMKAEAKSMSTKVESLEAEVDKERALSAEITLKCKELEDELLRKNKAGELQEAVSSNGEMKVKEEDLAVAAGKLAECQKTIASLGKQLKSLATLEDFLLDTANLPEFSGSGLPNPKADGEPRNLHSSDILLPNRDPESLKTTSEISGPSVNGNGRNSPQSTYSSASSAVSLNHGSSEKGRHGFGKLFARSKNGIQLDN
ncbi:filament-like plant protein isoform X2 [Malania oleifera]|uniref:filament-like plant protein isoform X2 n=1 Tax=Malania oleifera TaxID=397392 RepID=UPI0025ADDCD7|nr:filament-like plant protein isoform X2 [Malania oleifera]XP_057973506.1 filament-like plant protein isoform X2 [Malania oleifera]XP_057973507.1 filament-like plant protein isoform X2 [Malania oleifera]XP_057973508.1 filament-like plant protein isoform X2 [Malania oleifera]XP_057973510.1 filament-like plant protein isoform X2 [Malania oleifera]XP_057973511.1 filament-like plant protein isoform X2 [Malania oleifera]